MENFLSNGIIPQIKIEFLPSVDPSQLMKIVESEDAYQAALQDWDKATLYLQMEAKLLALNQAGRLLGIYPISKGAINRTVMDQRLVFLTAIRSLAVSIILVRNSPGGSLTPSIEDGQIYNGLKASGKLLEITCHDFLIITGRKYFSFKDNESI